MGRSERISYRPCHHVPLCPGKEGSATGVKAALAAGMSCIAVTTENTRTAVHASDLLDERWIVDIPSELIPVVKHFINQSLVLGQFRQL